MIRVVVADKDRLIAQALAQLLGAEQDMNVVGVFSEGLSLLRGMQARRPDVVLVDPSGLAGLEMELLRRIRAAHPAVAVIVLTAGGQEHQFYAAVRAGVRGYLAKTVTVRELQEAIRSAAIGGGSLTPAEARLLMEAFAEQTQETIGLTPRQRDILAGVVYANTNREIALALGLTEKTVRNYMRELFDVLGVSNRTAAAVQALQRDLVSERDWAVSSRLPATDYCA